MAVLHTVLETLINDVQDRPVPLNAVQMAFLSSHLQSFKDKQYSLFTSIAVSQV